MSKSSSPSRASSTVSEAPSDALIQLLSPDGYYDYLGIPKPKPADAKPASATTTDTVPDEDVIKKNYRRLSLKHHPDRRGGDAETFRVLNRAQRVLLNPKLRGDYDLMGIDLNDVEEHTDDNDNANEGKDGEPPAAPDTVVSQMATSTLAGIIQLGLRTVMMAAVATFACRYKILMVPMLGFLCFIAYRIFGAVKAAPANSGASLADMISPLAIGVGLLCLYSGRDFPDVTWSYTFWFGEGLVVAMFTLNSIQVPKSSALVVFVGILSFLVTLWLRGKLWRYVTVIGLEAFVGIVAVMAFPIMEMILDELLKEKMRKVGEKVRLDAKLMKEYYEGKTAALVSEDGDTL